jgi:hypothetical protein
MTRLCEKVEVVQSLLRDPWVDPGTKCVAAARLRALIVEALRS